MGDCPGEHALGPPRRRHSRSPRRPHQSNGRSDGAAGPALRTPAPRSWPPPASSSPPAASGVRRSGRSPRTPAWTRRWCTTTSAPRTTSSWPPCRSRSTRASCWHRSSSRARTAPAERLLRTFLGVWDDPEHQLPLIGLFRGLLEPTGERLLREGFLPVVLIPVGERLGIDRPGAADAPGGQPDARPDPAPLHGEGGADRLDERRPGRGDVRAGAPALPVRPAPRLQIPVDGSA